MVQGPGDPRHDGVADYTAHLDAALAEVGVDVVPVPLGPASDGHHHMAAPARTTTLARAAAPDGATPSGRGSAEPTGIRRHVGWAQATALAARRVRREQPDVVHVQYAPSAFRYAASPLLLPGLLPRGVPLVTTVHEYGWWTALPRVPDRTWRHLEAGGRLDRESGLLVASSDAVVVTNPQHAHAVTARTGAATVEIPLAANIELYPDAAAGREVRADLGLAPDARLVVFFGFVHPVKGVRYVLECLRALRHDCGDIHLLVVGGFTSLALPQDEADAFRAELLQRAADAGVAAHVTFTGHVDDREVSRLLQAADVGVLPFTAGVSTKSGALLALLGHGVPTAVTVADEPDPLLADGETVVTISRRRDAAAVREALTRLLRDDDLRRRLREAGPALVAARTWPAVAHAHLQLYDRLLDQRRSEPSGTSRRAR
jgi:glycosyltransferase involved in cell wall biosynthesis